MKILKRLSALLALLLCCAVAVPAYAHEVPDMTQTGSISAAMAYDGKAVGGGSLTLYRVGDVSEDDGNYSFTLTEDFAASTVSLENVSDAETAKKLADYAKANSLSGTTVAIGADGNVTAGNLSLGLYLVTQAEAAEGYEAISPFLVSIPMYENGVYVYDVDAEPKMETLTPVPEETEPEETEPADTDPGSSTPGTSTPSTPSASGTTSTPAAQTIAPAAATVLPQTGQLNWPVPVLTAAGLCLFLAGWKLCFGRQRKSHEA